MKGLATIYDKDILIFAISQIMAKLNDGQPVSPRVRINTRDFLIFCNRDTGGKDYKAFIAALERLRETTISTNIRTGDEEQIETFGLIDASSIRREKGLDGRLLWVEVTLSDWVFRAIRAGEVLTLNRDYFRLGKPYERRAYEIARKHCGRKADWRIGLELLRRAGLGVRIEADRFGDGPGRRDRQPHIGRGRSPVILQSAKKSTEGVPAARSRPLGSGAARRLPPPSLCRSRGRGGDGIRLLLCNDLWSFPPPVA